MSSERVSIDKFLYLGKHSVAKGVTLSPSIGMLSGRLSHNENDQCSWNWAVLPFEIMSLQN